MPLSANSGHSTDLKNVAAKGSKRPKAAIEKPRHEDGADHSASNYEVPRETRYAGFDHLPVIPWREFDTQES